MNERAMFRLLGMVVALVLATGEPRVAWSADDAEAHIKRGLEMRRQRRDAEALAEFKIAHGLSASPRALAQIALAELALSRWLEAERDLLAAMDAKGDAWIEERRQVLEESLRESQRHLGRLEVVTTAPGASMAVDGGESVPLPLDAPLRVQAGHVRVVVRAPGYASQTFELEVAGDAHVRQIAALSPLTAPSPATSLERAPTKSHDAPVLAWFALGSGVALVGGGVAAHVVRENAAHRYNDDAICTAPGVDRIDQCPDERRTIDTSQLFMGLGYGVGAAAIVTSIILFLTHPKARPASTSVACGPSLSGRDLHCRFHF